MRNRETREIKDEKQKGGKIEKQKNWQTKNNKTKMRHREREKERNGNIERWKTEKMINKNEKNKPKNKRIR